MVRRRRRTESVEELIDAGNVQTRESEMLTKKSDLANVHLLVMKEKEELQRATEKGDWLQALERQGEVVRLEQELRKKQRDKKITPTPFTPQEVSIVTVYQCEICGERCSRINKMKQHIQVDHKGILDELGEPANHFYCTLGD